ARPVLHAGGDSHLEAALTPDAARAAAGRTGVLDHAARPTTPWAGLRHGEEPLVHGDRARATAPGARHRPRPRRGPRAAAGRAGSRALHPDRNGGPPHRVVEGQPDLGLEVRPAGDASASPSAPGEDAEQVAEVPESGEVAEVLEADPAAAHPAGEPGAEARGGHLAHLVVLLALVLVADDVVRGRDLLEALLRGLVAGVRVRVIALRELAIGLLDLGLRGVLGHAQDLVVVLLEPLAPDVAVHGDPLALVGDAHPGRPDHPAAQGVSLTEHVGDDWLSVARARAHQRLVQLRIERLALRRLDALEPFPAQRVDELRVHELDAVQELVEVRLLLGRHERELELVQDLEQPAHEGLRGHLDRLGLLAQHPLAVVLELRLQAHQVVSVLGGLLANRLELGPARRLILGRGTGPGRASRRLRGEGLALGSAGGGRPGRRAAHLAHPAAIGHLDPRRGLLPALRPILLGHLAFTVILRGRASSRLRTSTVRTPLSKLASTLFGSAVAGSVSVRVNCP